LYKAIKYKTLETDQSIQNYIVNLVKEDLNFDDKDDDLSDYLPKK